MRPLKLHCTRQTYSSAALAASKSLRWVADQLGHQNPEFTLRTYAHLMPQEETDLSFADFGGTKRPYTAPVSEAATANENAPGASGRGRSVFMEHETRGISPVGKEAPEVWRRSRPRPSRWQGDAGVDSIEEFRLKRSYRVVSVNSGGRRNRDAGLPSRSTRVSRWAVHRFGSH
jgi:hypothetical protein